MEMDITKDLSLSTQLGIKLTLTDETEAKFIPEPDELPPVNELLDLSKVTASDFEDAKNLWQSKPPEEEFKYLLGD